jgi:hypothetical protein
MLSLFCILWCDVVGVCREDWPCGWSGEGTGKLCFANTNGNANSSSGTECSLTCGNSNYEPNTSTGRCTLMACESRSVDVDTGEFAC